MLKGHKHHRIGIRIMLGDINLVQITFLAEYRLFGLEPAGYLLVNLLIHAFNAFMVYMLVNMLFPRTQLAVLAGAVFVLGVEQVAGIKEEIVRRGPE